MSVFCFNSQKNVDQIQEAIGMLTKSAMDELIDSKHPAYRYDAAFGEFKSSRGLSTVVLVIFNAFKCIVFFNILLNLFFQTK